MFEKKCPCCGKYFETEYSFKVACSSTCGRKIDAEKRKSRGNYQKTIEKCVVCGEEYIKDISTKRFCSVKCRKAYHKKKHNEKVKQKPKRNYAYSSGILSREQEKKFLNERDAIHKFREGNPEQLLTVPQRAELCGVSYGVYVAYRDTMSEERFKQWEARQIALNK